MSPTLSSLEAQALTLSPQDRAALADHLLASLDAEHEVEDAWAEEVARRLAQIDAGNASLLPLEQVLARARQAIA